MPCFYSWPSSQRSIVLFQWARATRFPRTIEIPANRFRAGLSSFEWLVALRIGRTDVFGARADQAVVRVLLEHVCGPAGDPADGKDRREQLDVDPERVVGGRRVEVHV